MLESLRHRHARVTPSSSPSRHARLHVVVTRQLRVVVTRRLRIVVTHTSRDSHAPSVTGRSVSRLIGPTEYEVQTANWPDTCPQTIGKKRTPTFCALLLFVPC